MWRLRVVHYKKRADLRRVFSQRRGGSDRPHVAPAVKFTAGDFNVATLRGGVKIYAVTPLEPPLRVGAVDRPNANKKILKKKAWGRLRPPPCVFFFKKNQIVPAYRTAGMLLYLLKKIASCEQFNDNDLN